MRKIPLARLLLMGIATSCAVPAPAAAQSFELVELQREMNALLATRPGEYGIAAIDLDDGSTAAVNGQIPFRWRVRSSWPSRAYLSEVDQAPQPERHHRWPHRRQGDGGDDRAQRQSGRRSAVRHAWRAGQVQQWVRSHNISGMRIDRTIAQLLRERGHLADIKDVATPVAMVELLRILDRGTALSSQSRAYLLGLMSQCRTGTRRIRALLPVGTRVEDKTGTLDGITNDVGFITMPDGRRVAIAVFARGGRDRQPVIAQVSRMIYDRLADGVRNAVAAFMKLR